MTFEIYDGYKEMNNKENVNINNQIEHCDMLYVVQHLLIQVKLVRISHLGRIINILQ